MKRKVLSVMLAAAMTATVLAGCGDAADNSSGTADGAAGTETGGNTSAGEGSVYMLNFKPESDQQWKELAEIYTEQTGVEVNILTAAERNLQHNPAQSEMAKAEAPTIFNIGNATAAQTWNDYTLDLSDSALYEHLSDKSLVILNDNKVAGVANCYECYGIIYNKTILNDYCSLDGR